MLDPVQKGPMLLMETLHNFKAPNSDKVVEIVLRVVKTMEILVAAKRDNNNVQLQCQPLYWYL